MGRIIVTGVARGIGRALARHFHNRGETVIGTIRGNAIDANELSFEVASDVDVTDISSVERFATLLGNSPIDVLVNNAAIFEPDAWRDTDPDTVRRHFETNALGPFVVSRALAPKLRRGSRIVMISSGSASIENATRDDCVSYRMSKAALNMMGRVLASGLADAEVVVTMIHPGSVATRMNPGGGLAPEAAAARLAATIDRLTIVETGMFLGLDGARLPW